MNDDQWLALRCGSAKTVKLVEDLSALEVPAWTPMMKRIKRFPRVSKKEIILLPCLPSFVFVPETSSFLCQSIKEQGKCPSFSVMRTMGLIARFRSCELDHMRKVSDVKDEKKFLVPGVGVRVRIKAGAFQGLCGLVVSSLKREALVSLEGESDMSLIKFPPFLFDVVQA